MTSSVMDAMSGFFETWSISGSRCVCAACSRCASGARSEGSSDGEEEPSALVCCVSR